MSVQTHPCGSTQKIFSSLETLRTHPLLANWPFLFPSSVPHLWWPRLAQQFAAWENSPEALFECDPYDEQQLPPSLLPTSLPCPGCMLSSEQFNGVLGWKKKKEKKRKKENENRTNLKPRIRNYRAPEVKMWRWNSKLCIDLAKSLNNKTGLSRTSCIGNWDCTIMGGGWLVLNNNGK